MKKNFLLSVVLLCMAGLMAMAGSPVGKAKMAKNSKAGESGGNLCCVFL